MAANENLVTFALLTFNQQKYVREAVRSALLQEYSPLEIIISDDASSDGTFQIVEDEVSKYTGPHRVRLNRNSANLGLGDHLNLVVGMSESNFIVLAAGDDISFPARTSVLAEEYHNSATKYFYISSNAEIMDPTGQETGRKVIQGSHPNDLWRLVLGSAMPLGATSACTKGLFDFFGGLHRNLMNEDFVLPLRAHLLGRVVYLEQTLVNYRMGGGSMSQDNEDLSSNDRFAGRARYLARQQIAVANMLHDLCYFDSSAQKDDRFAEFSELKAQLCRRLIDLAAGEAYNHDRSQGRRFRASFQLFRAPRVLKSMVLKKLSMHFQWIF